MPSKTFSATLGSDAGSLFIEIPFDVKNDFGRARPPVKVSIAGYSYRSTVSVYGGKYYLPVRREIREATGVSAGDTVEVTVELDSEVRSVELPSPLASALAKNTKARARWEDLSYTDKKEYVQAILQAKKPETRARRIENIVEKLTKKR